MIKSLLFHNLPFFHKATIKETDHPSINGRSTAMKLFMKLLPLVVLVGLFAFVSANAQQKNHKVTITHNWQDNIRDGRDRDGWDRDGWDRDGRDRDGRDRDGRDRDGRDHNCNDNGGGSTFIAITINIINNGGSGTVSGPTSVQSGATANYDIVPDVATFSSFVLVIDGVPVYGDNVPYSFTLSNVTAPHTIEVTFSSLL
jgi:hypothetical protein